MHEIDSKEIVEIIKEFILRGRACFLPGIGVFKTVTSPSERMENELFPPGVKVDFDPDEKSGNSIVAAMSRSLQWSQEQADQLYEKWQKEIEKEIETDGRYKISGLGVLKKEDGKFQFEAFPAIPLFKKITQKERSGADSNFLNRKRPLVIGLSGLILIGVVLLGWFFLRKGGTADIENGFTNKQESTVEKGVLAEPADSTATENPGTMIRESDSLRFIVVYKDFSDREQAERYFKKMKSWGHDIVVVTRDSARYEAGYPYFGTIADTSARIQEIHQIYGTKTYAVFPQKEGYFYVFPEKNPE